MKVRSIINISLAVLTGLFFLPAASSLRAATNDANDEKQIVALLDDLSQATMKKDFAELNKIYGDDLTYNHSTGKTQNRSEMLKDLEALDPRTDMKFYDNRIRIFGSIALVNCMSDFISGAAGKRHDNHLNVLLVLHRNPGPLGWRIIARQAVKVTSEK